MGPRALFIGAAALAGGALTVAYRRDLAAAQARLQALGPRSAATSCGPVEYLDLPGDGPPVLVVHGIAGGHDQGATWARGYLGEEFRLIVPSRFGYLGSAMPADASPARQADVFAELLDAVGVARAGVLAVSAGVTSSVQFAARHPDRVAALVLSSPNAPGPVRRPPPRALIEALVASNVPFWFVLRFLRRFVYTPMFGMPKGHELTAGERAALDQAARELLPMTARRAGFLFDMFVSNADINRAYPFVDVRAPTLVVSAVDDPMAPHVNARALADAIPEARLLAIASGGHPLLGADEQVADGYRAFLAEHAAGARPSPP